MNSRENTYIIKQLAKELGFQNCGISKARFLEEEASTLEKWLKDLMHGKMQYMENHFDKRLDPRLLHPGTLSVVSLSINYFTEEKQVDDSYKVSKYAYGNDYHDVIRSKLNEFIERLKQHIPHLEGRGFVDSAPMMDKVWAKNAGLGWIGKHTNLLSKKQGSYFFLAELLINIECDYEDTLQTDHCGSCTKCIDACPTDAIVKPYLVDASKCISYFTIELKEELPSDMQGKFDDWIFGCDVCQEVCPWNRFSIAHSEPLLKSNERLLNMTRNDWENIKEEEFKILFKHSPIKRTKYQGLLRNIAHNKKRQ